MQVLPSVITIAVLDQWFPVALSIYISQLQSFCAEELFLSCIFSCIKSNQCWFYSLKSYPKWLWKITDIILWKIRDIILEFSRLHCIFLYKLSHVCQVSICILLLLFALGHSIVLRLLTENTVLQWLAIEPMSQNNWLRSCGSISGLSVLFCCFRHLLFY